jgi:hypothetical protein
VEYGRNLATGKGECNEVVHSAQSHRREAFGIVGNSGPDNFLYDE